MPNIANTNITYIPPIKNYKPNYRKPAQQKPATTSNPWQGNPEYYRYEVDKNRNRGTNANYSVNYGDLLREENPQAYYTEMYNAINNYQPLPYNQTYGGLLVDYLKEYKVIPELYRKGFQTVTQGISQAWNTPPAANAGTYGSAQTAALRANAAGRSAYTAAQSASATSAAARALAYAETGGYGSNTTVPTTRNPVNTNAPFSQWNSQWNMLANRQILGPWQSAIAEGVFSRPFRSVRDFDQSVAAMGLQPRYSTTASIPLRDPWAPDPYEGGGSPYTHEVLNYGGGGGGGGGGWGGGGGGGYYSLPSSPSYRGYGGGGYTSMPGSPNYRGRAGGTYGMSTGVRGATSPTGIGGYNVTGSGPSYRGGGGGRASGYSGVDPYNPARWQMPMLVWNI